MNAAARLVHQEALSRQLIYIQLLTRKQLAIFVLALMVLMSALSVIYVTHLSRELHANYEQSLAEQGHMQVQHGQLLLERSTWLVQARVQQVAENKLGMLIPNNKSVVIVHE